MTTPGAESPDRDAAMIRSAQRAVDRWTAFPLRGDLRPLVLLHQPVRVDVGFATGDAKHAFMQGVVEAANGVPDEAVRLLRTATAQMSRPPRAPLQVTAAEQSETEFATDRGPQCLEAWRVEATDARGPIWALTEELTARCWSPPPVPDQLLGPHMLTTATVGLDGRQLVVEFVGGSEQLSRYDTEVIESATAVSVVPLERPTKELPPGTVVTLEGYLREVTITLAEPLGDRVLVNLDSSPVPVRPASATPPRPPPTATGTPPSDATSPLPLPLKSSSRAPNTTGVSARIRQLTTRRGETVGKGES